MAVRDKWVKKYPTEAEFIKSEESDICAYLLANPTATRKHIVQKFRLTRSKVTALAKRIGFKFVGSRLPNDQVDERIRMFTEGMSVYRIAQILSLDTRGVDRWLSRNIGKNEYEKLKWKAMVP